MITLIPSTIINRTDLSIIERALFPLIVTRSIKWGGLSQGVSIPDLHAVVGGDYRQISDALNLLEKKEIIEKNRVRKPDQEYIYYRPHKNLIDFVNSPASTSMPVSMETSKNVVLSNYFLDMTQETHVELKQSAIDYMVNAGYQQVLSIFNDYEDEQRSQNTTSTDWKAHFRVWLRKKGYSSSPSNSKYKSVSEDMKPTEEQFNLAKYFYEKHTRINKGFEEPLNMQYEGYEIKLIIETTRYEIKDILKAINWLFSEGGNWYRPNVSSCEKLRKKMSYIYGHLVSYTDEQLLPEGTDVFELLNQVE